MHYMDCSTELVSPRQRLAAVAALRAQGVAAGDAAVMEWVAYRRARARFEEYVQSNTLGRAHNYYDTMVMRAQLTYYPQEVGRLGNHVRLRGARSARALMEALSVATVDDWVALPLAGWRAGLPLERELEVEGETAAARAAALASKPDFGRNANRGMRCPRCKGADVDSMQMQTRSADEAMTTKFICLRASCQHQWRVS